MTGNAMDVVNKAYSPVKTTIYTVIASEYLFVVYVGMWCIWNVFSDITTFLISDWCRYYLRCFRHGILKITTLSRVDSTIYHPVHLSAYLRSRREAEYIYLKLCYPQKGFRLRDRIVKNSSMWRDIIMAITIEECLTSCASQGIPSKFQLAWKFVLAWRF